MTELIQIAAICLVGAIIALLIKNSNPVFALLLILALALTAIGVAAGLFSQIKEFISGLIEISGLSGEIFSPLLKTVGISITAKVSADLCRDAGAAAAAGVIEIVGVLCAIIVAIPLMNAVIEMLMSFL